MLSTAWIAFSKAREHRRNARLTRAELESRKLNKFRSLARHAQKHSPYYARIVNDRGIDIDSCEPGDFPLLTKSALMANFDELVTDRRLTKHAIGEFLSRSKDPSDRFLNKYRVIHTSGSSGEVGYFVYSPADWARMGMGRRPGQPRPVRRRRRSGRFKLAFYGATDGHYAGVTATSAVKRNPILRLFVEVGIYEINTPLSQTIDALNEFRPDYLTGYTTALKILAEKQREGVLRLEPTGILTSGEVTTNADRALLEQAFGCGVTNSYACSEHLLMGYSWPGSSDMVLYDDDLIFECHDDHSVVTNLFNYTLPLIRYRMSDVLRPIPDASRYAPYLAIRSLVGRNELLPLFKNGDGTEDFVSPHTINEIFVPGVNRFQMHLLSDTSFRFMICVDPLLDPEQRAACRVGMTRRLREILDRKSMANVSFEVIETDDLPVNPKTRKFQLIVDARNACAGVDDPVPAG